MLAQRRRVTGVIVLAAVAAVVFAAVGRADAPQAQASPNGSAVAAACVQTVSPEPSIARGSVAVTSDAQLLQLIDTGVAKLNADKTAWLKQVVADENKTAQADATDPAFVQKVAQSKATQAKQAVAQAAAQITPPPSLKDTCPGGSDQPQALGTGGTMGIGSWQQIVGKQCVTAWIVQQLASRADGSTYDYYYLWVWRDDAAGNTISRTQINTPELSFVKGSGDIMTMKNTKGQRMTLNLKTLKLTTH